MENIRLLRVVTLLETSNLRSRTYYVIVKFVEK